MSAKRSAILGLKELFYDQYRANELLQSPMTSNKGKQSSLKGILSLAKSLLTMTEPIGNHWPSLDRVAIKAN